MDNKIVVYILLLGFFKITLSTAQVTTNEQMYNGFTSRSFMKFNRFLTVPTFSLLHEENSSVSGLVRYSNVEFNDAPRTYLVSYYGKMQDNIGAGLAVYQQNVGIFKDLGAIFNYAHQLQVGHNSDLAFGFNLTYSRRGADGQKVLSKTTDPTLQNYQDIPIINFQPAVTLTFGGNIDVGVYFENLLDYNLKAKKMVSEFSDKVITGYGAYTYVFENTTGFMEDAMVRVLAMGKKQPDGFGYGVNVIFDLPRIGWLKAVYDKTYGYQAGLGMNISQNIAIGFGYEKHPTLGVTNEIGVVYSFGERTQRQRPRPKPIRKKTTNKQQQVVGEDLTDELQMAQDSINSLNRKVEEVLRLLKNQPRVIRDTVTIKTDTKDTSLKRRTATPWRDNFIVRAGGGGTMYYVAIDQFKNLQKVKAKIASYKRRDVDLKYVKEPDLDMYYLYIEKYAKEEDAQRMVKEINGGKKGFENDEANDLGIKLKSVSRDPVYVVKVTLGGSSESYKEPKTQPRAKVNTLRMEGVDKGYYLRVNIFSQKSYADKFLDELKADDINTDYFIDPETGYRHVYIFKTNNRAEAIKMYNNNLNGTYYDRKAIIYIK